MRLRDMVWRTKNLRGVCGSWTRALHHLVFRGKETREGVVLRLRRLLLDKDMETFPMLRDCMVKFCHPHLLKDLYSLQQNIAESAISFEYVYAVVWRDDELMDVMRNKTSHLGYGPYSNEILDTFAEECWALGMKVGDSCARFPNGKVDPSQVTNEWVQAGLVSLENFYIKECLCLWYYNAHMFRQIVGAFPCLEVLEFPAFLHVPLLAKMKYFFPPCEDDSPFASISLSPPQMLQILGITYKEQGPSYSDIMASVKRVIIHTWHYNPILSLFNGGPYGVLSAELHIFLLLNHWMSDRNLEIRQNVIKRITQQAKAAVQDIPEKTKAKVSHFNTDVLMDVMDDTAGDD
ncbi:uncharacterized protein N7473_012584 [Penicillium subrubescens]|uniref:Uncharacterized protein n=1 Tax=Penicillium subrubescens TaxID=1316194 RepID=A0A1Q5U4R6_9EURO|nr:uncharacterized protein N7473_012584 [Penicillium subrubescens]KAJ5875237.1 hypothetical protein N7473_012584 [Penicillium subrubescens]OKP07472.1 hypothetical protein PENSUB_6061 [Penicillium subrubescens]